MRNFLINTIALTLLVLSSNAQSPYTLLKKGERNPYDTAVAVEIGQYRIETQKLKLGDNLIDSLRLERDKLIESKIESTRIINTQAATISTLTKSNSDKDKAFKDLNGSMDNLIAIVNEPKKWYEKPGVIVGAVVGLELIQIFTK